MADTVKGVMDSEDSESEGECTDLDIDGGPIDVDIAIKFLGRLTPHLDFTKSGLAITTHLLQEVVALSRKLSAQQVSTIRTSLLEADSPRDIFNYLRSSKLIRSEPRVSPSEDVTYTVPPASPWTDSSESEHEMILIPPGHLSRILRTYAMNKRPVTTCFSPLEQTQKLPRMSLCTRSLSGLCRAASLQSTLPVPSEPTLLPIGTSTLDSALLEQQQQSQ